MKKHWAFPGVIGPYEASLPRCPNLTRDEESSNGTSYRDSVAFLYPKVKAFVTDHNFLGLQRLLLAAVARLISEELHRRKKLEYQTMTYRMRLELALRENVIRPDIFLSISQLDASITSDQDCTHHLCVFSSFLHSISPSPLHFEPFLSQLSSDPSLTEVSAEVRFLNRDFNAVFA